ncbi:hypothetical protein E3N88_13735 [Mikania micrantha]|uniref:Uncharacterized protein n=1 Tax=Mikania micrantha TaxID=192012 RepID=A0A5N6P2H5_9ASTR|nr:hypothetical protein E3N88_13735 [Mikania micrantha]
MLPASLTNSSKANTGRHLSSKEFDEKRAKGECFWCNDKFTPGHNCKNKQLFLFKILEEEEEDMEQLNSIDTSTKVVDSDLDHHISLHAIIVTIVDGNQLPCTKLCKDFQWIMQGSWFKVDMLVIPLSTYDIVLGIQ